MTKVIFDINPNAPLEVITTRQATHLHHKIIKNGLKDSYRPCLSPPRRCMTVSLEYERSF